MSNLMQASRQWASRPADERFLSLIELEEHTRKVAEASHQSVMSSRRLEFRPVDGDLKGITVTTCNDDAHCLTNWSFGQTCTRVKAHATYLRTLPTPYVADVLNYEYGLRNAPTDTGVLLYRNGGPSELRALTGPNYGRVWNHRIVSALADRFGDGVTGQFRVPGIFGEALQQATKDNTTLYASDRDMFVFLADEEHRIEISNRRDGQSGSLARGFFVWNSEVGSKSLGIATFLFDYVCANRIVWGASEHKEISIRHTSSAPDRFVEEVTPALLSYAQSSTMSITDAIEKARKARIDDVDQFLDRRFSQSQAAAIKAAHMQDEGRPIETLWDATTGITAYARGIQHQDSRVDLERIAGKVLDLA